MDSNVIQSTGSGYVVEILFEITNRIFFQSDERSMVVAREDGREYTLESIDNERIQGARVFKLKCGVYELRQEAEEGLNNILLNLQLYLCSICAHYTIMDTYIDDLSVITMRESMRGKVTMGAIRSWNMPKSVAMRTDEKADRAMWLFKAATEAKDTSVAFLLQVIALEALTEMKRKDNATCDLLNSFLRQIGESALEQPRKEALRTAINYLQNESATNSIKLLIKKLGLENKSYGGYDVNSLVSKSYALRSSFAHDGIINDPPSNALRMLLTDVLRAYMEDIHNKR